VTTPPTDRDPAKPDPADSDPGDRDAGDRDAGDRDAGDRDATAARAFARADGLDRARAAESRAAALLITDFARRAAAANLATTRLRARSYGGNASYRTNVDGWYIRRDHSIGIGADGSFYVLSAPTSLAARVSGVVIAPSNPPLELGRGARDGESIPLADALEKRLAAGDAFP
jgi:hypothetical protein